MAGCTPLHGTMRAGCWRGVSTLQTTLAVSNPHLHPAHRRPPDMRPDASPLDYTSLGLLGFTLRRYGPKFTALRSAVDTVKRRLFARAFRVHTAALRFGLAIRR